MCGRRKLDIAKSAFDKVLGAKESNANPHFWKNVATGHPGRLELVLALVSWATFKSF